MSGPPSEPAPASGLVIGRYSLFGAIAAGGMATVHFGRLLGPVGFSRTVAIKRLHKEYARDPEFVSMFLDEARLAARIRHPNVVPTLDVVATKGEVFLVMEYIQGESLSRLVKLTRELREPIPPRIAVSIMSGALQGLHAAHEASDERGVGLGIVHRDVSPHNILVGVDGMARVLDFGVAKAAGRMQTTRDGQIKGKLAYMAPEQMHADGIDRKADVYAAAVVLWELFAGDRLFKGDSEAVVLARVIKGEVKPPSQVRLGLAPAFDAVVLKGLARDPKDRYDTAKEMAVALEKCDGTASLAEVATWIERVAGNALHERATMIARIESDTGKFHSVDSRKASMAAALARSPDSLTTLPNPKEVEDAKDDEENALPIVVEEPSEVRAPRKTRLLRGGLVAIAVLLLAIGVQRMSRSTSPGVTMPGDDKPATSTVAIAVTPIPPASAAAIEVAASAAPEASVPAPTQTTTAKSAAPSVARPATVKATKKSESANPFDLGGRN